MEEFTRSPPHRDMWGDGAVPPRDRYRPAEGDRIFTVCLFTALAAESAPRYASPIPHTRLKKTERQISRARTRAQWSL